MHIPVFARAAVEWLQIRHDGVYVDCTAGAGGHSEAIAQRVTDGRLIALDRDSDAVEKVAKRLRPYSCATVVHANYGELAATLKNVNVVSVDGVLIDAGISSVQLDSAERGFSFQKDGPLDMRMDTTTGLTAAEWLGHASVDEIATALRTYGDVGPAQRIATSIARRSKAGSLNTTRDLAGAVHEALDFVTNEPEETRTVFQAIRIAVNNELGNLESGLHDAIGTLNPGGRLVVIAFHSGEDRVVKHIFQQASRKQRELYPDGRVKSTRPAMLRLLTPKPITPDPTEVAANSRAHSAKLRVAERLVDERKAV